MRKKIKHAKGEIEEVKQKIQRTEKKKNGIIFDKEEKEMDTKALKDYKSDLHKDLQLAKTSRQLHFERLLIQQKKISLYNDLLLGRKPFRVYKNEDIMVQEYQKQKILNGNLVNVIIILKQKFPNYLHEFEMLYNTLSLASLIFYNSI